MVVKPPAMRKTAVAGRAGVTVVQPATARKLASAQPIVARMRALVAVHDLRIIPDIIIAAPDMMTLLRAVALFYALLRAAGMVSLNGDAHEGELGPVLVVDSLVLAQAPLLAR